MACIILQKQIDCIDGKKEKIETPGVKMRKITKQAKKEEAGMLSILFRIIFFDNLFFSTL